MASVNTFPHSIVPMDAEVASQIRTLFSGQNQDFVRVGEHGFVLPERYSEVAADIFNMEVRPDDIWNISFGRCGCSWSQEMTWLLANDLDYEKAAATPQHYRYPYLEYATMSDDSIKQMLQDLEGVPTNTQRFIKTHLPFSLLPPKLEERAKVVYVARDPRDVAVSCYHLSRLFKFYSFNGSFETYWDLFTNDLVPHAPFFQHVKEGWDKRSHPNVMFMFYEEMSKDLKSCCRRMADFLGKQYTEEQLDRLTSHLSFDNFKKNDAVNRKNAEFKDHFNEGEEPFIRKGKVGGWSEYLDEERRRQAARWMHENLLGSDLKFPHVSTT